MVRSSAPPRSAGVVSIASLVTVSKPLPTRWVMSSAAVVIRHPGLWVTALWQMKRLTPNGWWHRWPFLPVPDAAYMRFRMVTAYGGDGGAPQPEDLITYLHWCKAWPNVTADRQNKY